jgi:hypothetical protein
MPRRKLFILLLILVIPPVIVGSIVLILMNWRLRTRVNSTIVVNRVQFSAAAEKKATPLLKSVEVLSLSLERFSGVQFRPNTFRVANPKQYVFATDTYPAYAWSSLDFSRRTMTFKGSNPNAPPRLTFENASSKNLALGRLDELQASSGAQITLEAMEDRTLNIIIQGKDPILGVTLVPNGEFQLVADHSQPDDVKRLPFDHASLAYRVRLADDQPTVSINGQENSLVLIGRFHSDKDVEALSNTTIPVDSLNLTRPDQSTGDVISAITQEFDIGFPDYPGKEKIRFRPSSNLSVSQFDRFAIVKLVYRPAKEEFSIEFDGVVGEIKIGHGKFMTDYRATALDYFRYSNHLITMAVVLAWVIAVSVAAIKLYKDVKEI